MTEYYETLQNLIKNSKKKEPPPRSLEELISYPGALEEKLTIIEERIKEIDDHYDRVYYYQQELLRASKDSP